MSQNKYFDHIFFIFLIITKEDALLFLSSFPNIYAGVQNILKSCTHHNRWFTLNSMTFSVIYVTADTLQVKPLYVTLRNPINWLRGSPTCIDDDQP